MPTLEHSRRKALQLKLYIEALLPPTLHEVAVPLVEGSL
jgi:hypothetical protein